MHEKLRKIFREEAVRHHLGTGRDGSDVLRVDPRWLAWTYQLLLAAMAIALVFAIVSTIHEYAVGPAVIRLDHRVDVHCVAAGVVSSVEVHPGQRVHTGDPLIRFDAADELATLRRVDEQYEQELVRLLRDPSDPTPRQALATLSAERDAASARLSDRTLRAPSDGIVSDLRVRAGQALHPGELVASFVGADSSFSVVALLPGYARPQIDRGQRFRIELIGYRHQFHDVVVDAVGESLMGPSEVKRYLGPEIGDSIAVAGPVIVVSGHLVEPSFVADGQALRYYDGMTATAELRLSQRRLLTLFVPWLRGLDPHAD